MDENLALDEFEPSEPIDLVADGEKSATDLAPVFGPDRAGDIRDSLADISKARNLLGYDPQVRIREGLRQTLAWFKANQAFIQERS